MISKFQLEISKILWYSSISFCNW